MKGKLPDVERKTVAILKCPDCEDQREHYALSRKVDRGDFLEPIMVRVLVCCKCERMNYVKNPNTGKREAI